MSFQGPVPRPPHRRLRLSACATHTHTHLPAIGSSGGRQLLLTAGPLMFLLTLFPRFSLTIVLTAGGRGGAHARAWRGVETLCSIWDMAEGRGRVLVDFGFFPPAGAVLAVTICTPNKGLVWACNCPAFERAQNTGSLASVLERVQPVGGCRLQS